MTSNNFLFTSESVSKGHPDKICDQVSDAILDLYLTKDPFARVAVEAMATPSKVIIAGEVSHVDVTSREIDILVRNLIKDIGYEQELFHWQKIAIDIMLNKQSPDIAMGINNDKEGAGDQGIMFGFACDETENLMPATIFYAHKILENIANAIKRKEILGLGPDAKSQVTLVYQDNIPVKASSVVVSIQHHNNLTQKDVKEMIRPFVVSVFPDPSWMVSEENFYVNPTGKFTIGGPESDTGLTGRKIIVDTYGGAAPHGGGALSGKDPTKVDRSAAYAARYLAKNVVAAKIAKRCTIQISYAIGIAKPLSFYVNTHGSCNISDEKLAVILPQIMDLSPKSIRKTLELNRPIYLKTASYGHFGRVPEEDGSFSWEKTDLVDKILKLC